MARALAAAGAEWIQIDEPTLVLDSVMTGKGVRLASINGQIVKEGDRVKGDLVRRIAGDGVELARGGSTRRLPRARF